MLGPIFKQYRVLDLQDGTGKTTFTSPHELFANII